MSTELASSRHERVGLREGDEIENLDDSVVEIVVCIDRLSRRCIKIDNYL